MEFQEASGRRAPSPGPESHHESTEADEQKLRPQEDCAVDIGICRHPRRSSSTGTVSHGSVDADQHTPRLSGHKGVHEGCRTRKESPSIGSEHGEQSHGANECTLLLKGGHRGAPRKPRKRPRRPSDDEANQEGSRAERQDGGLQDGRCSEWGMKMGSVDSEEGQNEYFRLYQR